jgi:hypothetical protein
LNGLSAGGGPSPRICGAVDAGGCANAAAQLKASRTELKRAARERMETPEALIPRVIA